jgi:hypothetical protein
VIGPVELDELRARDVLGEVAAFLDPCVDVVPAVKHQRGHLYGAEHVAHVDQ